MEVSFYLYFADREDAGAAGNMLRTDGFAVDVRESADEINWLVLAEAEREPQELDDLEGRMYALAEEFGGEYDGYERSVR